MILLPFLSGALFPKSVLSSRAFNLCNTTYKVDDYVLVSSDINNTEDVAKVYQLKDLIDNGEYTRISGPVVQN